MDCVINAKELSVKLNRVASIAPKKSVKEVLGMVAVTVLKDSIELKSTNALVELKGSVSTSINVKKEGSVLVNAEKLSSIVKSFGDADCSLKATAKNLIIKCNKSVFKLALSLDIYCDIQPENKVVRSCTLEASALETLINNVSFAADNIKSSVTYAYDTILLEGDKDFLKCVATDGTRFSYGQIKCEGLKDLYHLFSPKAFDLLAKISDKEIVFKDYGNIVVFETNGFVYTVRPMEGKLPDYTNALTLPNEYFFFKIDRKEFLKIINQVMVISNYGYRSAWLKIDAGKLIMYTDVVDNNQATVEAPIATNVNKEVLIKLNSASLCDVVKIITDDRIRLVFTTSTQPVRINWNDYKYLVMPLTEL